MTRSTSPSRVRRLVGGLALVAALVPAACGPASTPQPAHPTSSPSATVTSPAPQPTSATPEASGSPTAPASSAAAKAPVVVPTPYRSATHRDACGGDYYVNSDGNCVHRPESANSAPDGATARCADGTYSFSQHRQGTCSHHGGVAQWL